MAEQPGGPVADQTFRNVAVGDPLKPVTRQQRLYLLAVSMIGIAIVKTGLIPSKIATFGIELNKPNRSALLFLLALVTIYFLVSFIIYAASDYLTRLEALQAAQEREVTRARYEEVAIVLQTSEETLRRQYAQNTADFEHYVNHRFKALLGRESPDKDTEMRTKRTIEFLEGSSDDPPARVHPDESGDPPPFQYLEYTVRPSRLIALTRLFFEFYLPPIVGLYAIYALLFRAFIIPEILASIATFIVIGMITAIVFYLLFPGYFPGWLIGAALIGVVGAFIGSSVGTWLVVSTAVWGINPTSILAATVGALTLLIIYRLIARLVML
jgi:uncharacterized membrane protein YeaQ/YmgE (transglycosylase-associated protein family)